MNVLAQKVKKHLDRPIILVGMMGTGKTVLGLALSDVLKLPFYDSDYEIEQDQGRSITEIFAADGEAVFRVLEKQKIKDLIDDDICVIATGGGALVTPENLERVKEGAVSVWLKVDVDIIFSRIGKDEARPLLQTDNPLQTLEGLLSARESLYAQADIHIDNNSADIDGAVEAILQKLLDYHANEDS